MSERPAVYFPLIIELPWPAAKLSPNGRGHWATKEDAREAAKQIGCYETARQAPYFGFDVSGPLKITLEFHPPNYRRYDWDNLVNRMKYYQDGICLNLGVNDNQIKRAEVVMGEVVHDGAVIVKIEPLSD